MQSYSLSLVGATGLVGSTFLKILEYSPYNFSEIRLYASEKSSGKLINFKGKQLKVEKLDSAFNPTTNFTIFMTNKSLSLKYAKIPLMNNSIVIDNSTAFRMNKNVPLVVPTLNGEIIYNNKLISNPNCVVAICALPLFYINKYFKLKKLSLTSFQSVSGSGKNGITALNKRLKNIEDDFYPLDISKNPIPLIGKIQDNLYSEEENKIADEIKKILCNYEISISCSCVRIPIERGHFISLSFETEKNADLKEIEEILQNKKDIKYIKYQDKTNLPSLEDCIDKSYVSVGRLRKENATKNGFLMFVCGDNLFRGSAYNAYEIMDYCIKNGNL